MTRILALQQLAAEPTEALFPCFSISASTITVHTM
jgi:hypothetical protein